MVSVTYFGVSNFLIRYGSRTFLIDPCFQDNPMTRVSPEDVVCDCILITHGGRDHLGDASEILERNPNAKVYAPADVTTHLVRMGLNASRAYRMVPGAARSFGDVVIKAVQSVHISFVQSRDLYLTGVPLGFIVTLGGTKLYHTGDTCLFSDLKLIGECYAPNVMCVPIGMFPGAVTEMEPWEAALAVSWVKPKLCFPMHYDPVTQGDYPEILSLELSKRLGGGSPQTVTIPFDHTVTVDEATCTDAPHPFAADA